ncbi:MAG: uroporphyrinogen decarboxylase family protein [Armatimonadota bacterium]
MENVRRSPDFSQFLKVLARDGKPDHLPFYEHIASAGFIARRTSTDFDKMPFGSKEYWNVYVDFWLGLGFDCVPMEIPLRCSLGGKNTGALSAGSEANAVICSSEDFENYDWPDESNPIDFSHFDVIADLLPDGAKIVGGVCMGPFEWVSEMMGVMGLSYALMDDMELVELMFDKIGRLILSADRQLATIDAIGALRQGDDLGFNTSTFLSPDLLRRFVFPTYKHMAEEAHKNNKPFILHSCGNLGDVYDDLIDYCKIDAKHSYEDNILPVGEFKRIYGNRITPLGGLDVDVICRGTENELRTYVRKKIDECFHDGYWAFGTGNSLTDYMPVENYMIALDEAIKATSRV